MLDINKIQEYNERVSTVSKKLQAKQTEYEMKHKELLRLCAELTEELGVEVTEENLEEICEMYEQQVSNTLQAGEEILRTAEAELNYADTTLEV